MSTIGINHTDCSCNINHSIITCIGNWFASCFKRKISINNNDDNDDNDNDNDDD